MAMANTKANKVSKFSENPMMLMKNIVPIKATGIAMAGIKVERKSCKKIYTTRNTKMKASTKVCKTLLMDSYRKSLELCMTMKSIPVGKLGRSSSMTLLQSSITWVALLPGSW